MGFVFNVIVHYDGNHANQQWNQDRDAMNLHHAPAGKCII